jgi:hypothetical protein
MNIRGIAVLMMMAVVVSSCGDPSGPASCDPAVLVPGSIDLTALPGNYMLRFIVSSGLRTGASVSASLRLHPQQDSLIVLPDSSGNELATGTLDIDPATIGAADTGDPKATSDVAPGVGVYEFGDPESPQLVARVGSISNARGPALFDGAYFTLFLLRANAGGISGSWRSGSGPGFPPIPEARGRFCADRLP